MSLLNPPILPNVLHFAESLTAFGTESLRRAFSAERRAHTLLPPPRALVINGHPDPRPERFCAALAHACAEGSRQAGWQTEELALGAYESLEGRPDEDLLAAFGKYNRAEYVTLVFPLWLNRAPPLLTAFLNQAAEEDTGIYPARTRSHRIVVTMDLPAFAHRSMAGTPRCPLSLAGIAAEEAVFVGSVGLISSDKRAEWIRTLRETAKPPRRR